MTPLPSLLRSEWTKLLSLRSTKVALALSVLLALALTALLAVVAGATRDEWSAADRSSWDPAEASLIGGLPAALVLAVLGVTTATGEYASGTIRLTFAATPRRGRVLAAKTLVVAAVTLAASLVAYVAMFLLGQALFGAYDLPTAGLFDGDAPRLVFVNAALAPLLPVVGMLAGLALRAAAAAITGLFAFTIGLPILAELLPPRWQQIFDFLLFEGGPEVNRLALCLFLVAVAEDVLSSLSALAGASCRLELSRLLNSVVGLRRPDESGSWPGQDRRRRGGGRA